MGGIELTLNGIAGLVTCQVPLQCGIHSNGRTGRRVCHAYVLLRPAHDAGAPAWDRIVARLWKLGGAKGAQVDISTRGKQAIAKWVTHR